MKIDIPYYIRQVLREQRSVYVAGLGLFTLEQSSAFFNDNKSSLNPPKLAIHFDAEGESNDALERYMIDDGHKVEKVKKKINSFSQKAFNQLLNVDSFEVMGLGEITKSNETGDALFVPDVSLLTDEFKGLAPISVSPITRIVEDNSLLEHAVSTSAVIKEETRKPKSGSPWWIPILGGILVAAIYIFAVDGCNRSNNQQLGLNSDTISSDTSMNEVDVEDSLRGEVPSFSGGNSTPKGSNELDLKYKEVDKIINDESSGEQEDDNTGRSEEVISAKGVGVNENVESAVDKKENFNEFADIIPANGRCTIIVGSFRRATNITKMISRVERAGYRAMTSQYNGLTRVGFSFDCRNENLDNYLQDIRKRISAKAWYLEPEHRVEY